MRITILYFLIILIAAFLLAGFRSCRKGERIFRYLGLGEIAVITLLISTLIVFGFLQIILRNFFHAGIIWADPLMRHIVLWLGCLGGAFASTRMKHINIDVLSRLLPAWARPFRDRLVSSVTALASSVLATAALKLVLDEKTYGEKSFLGISTWIVQVVIPLAFFLIAYRSARLAIVAGGDELHIRGGPDERTK